MRAETADYLDKARGNLADATKIARLPLPHIAAREAYLAVFHASEAYIFERTGKVAKTHRGVRSEFTPLARADQTISRDLITFLGAAYQFKTIADYAVGPAAAPISDEDATADSSTPSPRSFPATPDRHARAFSAKGCHTIHAGTGNPFSFKNGRLNSLDA
jgi:uncharacterized protein (UPF0332 family)